MSISFVKIANGVTGCHIPSKNFKTTRISVNMILPMDKDNAAQNAILPFVLTRSCAAYPDYTALNAKLSSLYGASLYADTLKLGDAQVLRIVIGALDDRFVTSTDKLSAECAKLITELIFRPVLENGIFRESDIESEKRLFLERINGEINNKRSYAVSRCEEIMGEGTPFGVPKYGTAEQAQALTSAVIYESLKSALKNAHIRINVIGQSDPTPIFEGFAKEFSSLSRTLLALSNSPTEISEPKTVNDKMAVSQGKLVMGFTTGIEESSEQAVAFRVMTDLFGGGPYSKLFLNVREKLSLCYYCAARYNRRKGILLVDSGVEQANVEKAQDEILKQLDAMKQGDFTEEELSFSKMSMADSLGTVSDSPSSLDSWYTERLFDENPLSPEAYTEKLLAVTADDIAQSAKLATLTATYIISSLSE